MTPSKTLAGQTQIQILLGSSSDLPVTEDGTALLKQLGLSFSLRICSAHRTPAQLHDIIKDFDSQGGQVYIGVAGMSAHLAGVIAALTLKPVLAVPVYRAETAGFDALLAMGQMPKGIPVGTMSFGKHGFINACIQAAQIIALHTPELARKLTEHRQAMMQQVLGEDERCRQSFHG